MNGHQPKPHFVLVPFMAQGHTIPMVDAARLLAERGAHVSFITTPANAARIKPVIDRTRASGLPVRFEALDFPCAAAGLPEGCENIDLITNQHHYTPFFEALPLLGDPLRAYLRDLTPPATCIVSDNIHWWTAELARELDIPRIVFHGPSCFYLLCCHNIRKHRVYEGVLDESEPVIIPELPDTIEITKAQEPGGWFESPGWEKIRQLVLDAETTADGVIVNTFRELEPEYIERYQKELNKPVLPIGPVSLYKEDAVNKASRGDKATVSEQKILSWLDLKDQGSVLFVSFGSLAQKPAAQLIELGRGLEASGRPFVWVIKEAEKCKEVEEWVLGVERGLVITGWAPQVVILSHPAIGGFMTHCGWNSILEAVVAGVPMITWPHFADQFLNERLVVDVLGIGVGIGVKVPCFPKGAADEVVVRKEVVEEVVLRLMEGGREGEERRRRAREFSKAAHEAMEEGGSSYEDLSFLIKYVKKLAK